MIGLGDLPLWMYLPGAVFVLAAVVLVLYGRSRRYQWLSDLLRSAEQEMRQKGDADIFDSDGSCIEFADKIAAQRARLDAGKFDPDDDFWVHFYPTATWDDAGGTSHTANAICDLLKSLKKKGR